MIDQKKRSEMEQGMEMIAEVLPTQSGLLYRNFMLNGFTSEQAMDLVKEYIRATFNGMSE